nr:hypothetical protein Iba_chr12cCG0040 [Ipomoea batatas]
MTVSGESDAAVVQVPPRTLARKTEGKVGQDEERFNTSSSAVSEEFSMRVMVKEMRLTHMKHRVADWKHVKDVKYRLSNYLKQKAWYQIKFLHGEFQVNNARIRLSSSSTSWPACRADVSFPLSKSALDLNASFSASGLDIECRSRRLLFGERRSALEYSEALFQVQQTRGPLLGDVFSSPL